MAVLAAAALAISAASALADDPASSGLLAEQLAAGEFAPAIADAGNAPPGERDARLAQIAGAQAEGGDRDAALSTAGDIGDDMARYNAIERVKREPVGGRGGGVQPDFDSLIELITSTIAPTTWSEVGGAGAVKQFPTGVYVDPAGMLCRAVKPAAKDDLLAWASAPLQAGGNRRARHRDCARFRSRGSNGKFNCNWPPAGRWTMSCCCWLGSSASNTCWPIARRATW
jgi:hypothetical protein